MRKWEPNSFGRNSFKKAKYDLGRNKSFKDPKGSTEKNDKKIPINQKEKTDDKSQNPENNFERKRVIRCYQCGMPGHIKPFCTEKLDRSDNRNQFVNNLSAKETLGEGFEPYLHKAIINGEQREYLRDTGSFIDVCDFDMIKLDDVLPENVWIRQPLDMECKSLPLAKIVIETEYGNIVTKAAVKSANLSQGYYLMGNKTAKLIEELKQKDAVPLNAVLTLNQTEKDLENESDSIVNKLTDVRESYSENGRVLEREHQVDKVSSVGEITIDQTDARKELSILRRLSEGEQPNMTIVTVEDSLSDQKGCEILKELGEKNEGENSGQLVVEKDKLTRKISSNDNRHVITAFCQESKNPIPVAHLDSRTVVQALFQILSRFRFHREIQGVNGRYFTSELNNYLFDKFDVEYSQYSIRHPRSSFVGENVLPMALFALRTIVRESTGFSPAELIHGTKVRMSHTIVFDNGTKDEGVHQNGADYVLDPNGLKRYQSMANKMKGFQDRNEKRYEMNAVLRRCKMGNEVMVLDISKDHKTSISWLDPGIITGAIPDTNYTENLTGKKNKDSVCQVKLIKPCYKRPEYVNLIFGERGKEDIEKNAIIPYTIQDPTHLDFDKIVKDKELEDKLSANFSRILTKYRGGFPTDPSNTSAVKRDVISKDDIPIRSCLYYMAPRQIEILNEKTRLDLFPKTKTITEIRSFLGLHGYCARLIRNHATNAVLLTDALKGKVKEKIIDWTNDCEIAFQNLKAELMKEPVLYAPDFAIEFLVSTDAILIGAGVVLTRAKNEAEHSMVYLSKKLFKKMESLFGWAEVHFSDGQESSGLSKENDRYERVTKSALFLKSFSFTVQHKPGKIHLNADVLSRLHDDL